MEYRVTYIIGERMSEAVMTQRELDTCRARCEVIEAVLLPPPLTCIPSVGQQAQP